MAGPSITMLFCAFLAASCTTRPTGDGADNNEVDPSLKLEQDKEYFRYLRKVIHLLEEDPAFQKRSEFTRTREEAGHGKLIEGLMPLLSEGTTGRLNQLKEEEIEYQKRLVTDDDKHHMKKPKRNEWNPIHHEAEKQKEFTQVDLTQLLNRFNTLQDPIDIKRKELFKKYEIKKELLFREEIKRLSTEEREEAEKKHEDEKKEKKTHEKVHAPGHKAQVEEVWEEEDGLDKDAFDEKTFFNLHDKDGDGYLDRFELETLFLSDVGKIYNESDPNMDKRERDEELERMREEVMKEMDVDNDGLVSLKEFMDETETDEFKEDEEWDPVVDKDQYTEEELEAYRRETAIGEEEDEDHEED